MLSPSPGRRLSELERNADFSSLETPTSNEDKRSTPVGRDDQRRCGQRSSSRGASSGSVSSGSRLTPPGQRTPSLSFASPPSLEHLAGGIDRLPRHCAAAPEGLPANPEACSPPSRQRATACGSISGCGSFASPPCLLGFAACVGAFTADRTTLTPRPHGGAAPSASGASGSSSSAFDRSDDDSSRDDAARPPPEAAAGRWALPDRDRNSRCAGGAAGEGDGYPKNAVQTCGGGGGGHDESGAGNDDGRCEPSGGGGREKDKRTGHDAGESGRDGGNEEGDPGGRQGNDRGGGGDEGGGGEGGDDGDGTGNNGSGTQGMGKEETEEHEDGEEEAEERDADEAMATFLRLSEVDFCEGIDGLQLGSTSAAARDSSIGRPSSGSGGDENVLAISRHLSDFFRSPLALDPTPKRGSSSIRSLSDVQTGARLFDNVKSPGSDDGGAFSAAVGGTSPEVANSVLINCVGSPPSSASPAAGSAAGIPDTGAAAAIAAYPSGDTGHAQTAEIDELPAKIINVCEPAAVEVNDEPCEPEQTEAVEEETEQSDGGHRDESTGDGGGGESEEEWLTGDVVEPTLERWSDNCPLANLNPTSTSIQEAESKAARTAATVGTHWAGLNEDGSWRTEVARKAAGKAGEVEAERRRLAKIIADESWRSDAGEVDGAGRCSRRNVRRDSVIRLQSGNVRYA